MPKLIALLVITLLLATSEFALACTLFPHEPSHIFENSDSLVLARPLEISPDPVELERLKGNYSYLQIVTWQVIRAWKGSFNDGDTFVTTTRVSATDPCSGWGVISDYRPGILHSVAGAPFHLYYAANVDHVIPQLNALEEQYEKSGE